VPGALGFRTLVALVDAGARVADISFFAEDALALDAAAKRTGAIVVTDIGVAPGLDNLLLGHHDAAMQVTRFECLVGGLPVARTLPYQYKAPFSPADVIEEYLRPARIKRHGAEVVRPALSEPEYVDFPGVGTLEAFHTDGLRSLLRTMPHVEDMVERTLRYPGHRELMLALRDGGFFADEPIEVDGAMVRPRALTSKLLFDAWRLEPGEPELTVMRVTIEGVEHGARVRHVYHLDDRGDPVSRTSSMARTTGYTCTGMVECLLDGSWTTAGVTPPEVVGRSEGLWPKIREHLAARAVTLSHARG
jgi:saccharopine dehydrogenase-like NADP-dependent oxidoreductase